MTTSPKHLTPQVERELDALLVKCCVGLSATTRSKIKHAILAAGYSKSPAPPAAKESEMADYEIVSGKIAVPLALAAKLGSIAVHADEITSPDGHAFDKAAITTLLHDADVIAFIKWLGPLVPRKRKP